MNDRRFDDFTRSLGSATSRRSVLKALAGVVLGSILGHGRSGIASASECTFNFQCNPLNPFTFDVIPQTCFNGTCVPACLENGKCFDGICQNGVCAPAGAICGNLGETCDHAHACCSLGNREVNLACNALPSGTCQCNAAAGWTTCGQTCCSPSECCDGLGVCVPGTLCGGTCCPSTIFGTSQCLNGKCFADPCSPSQAGTGGAFCPTPGAPGSGTCCQPGELCCAGTCCPVGTPQCLNGICACQDGTQFCPGGGAPIPGLGTRGNCCAQGQSCVAGVCTVCNSTNCSGCCTNAGVCVSPATSAACGMNGDLCTACPDRSFCNDGVCICTSTGQPAVNGTCPCNPPCTVAGTTCQNGQCLCPSGQPPSGGQCACVPPCASPQVCVAGVCMGGACNRVCPVAGVTCLEGQCGCDGTVGCLCVPKANILNGSIFCCPGPLGGQACAAGKVCCGGIAKGGFGSVTCCDPAAPSGAFCCPEGNGQGICCPSGSHCGVAKVCTSRPGQ